MKLHPKVTAGVFASYVVIVLMAIARRYGIEIDSLTAAGIDGIVTTIAGFWMPSEPSLTLEQIRAILAAPTGETHA